MWLLLVRKEGEDWVIDRDSAHILNEQAGQAEVKEISVQQIRNPKTSECSIDL